MATRKQIVVAQIMGKWVGGGVESVIMNYYRHINRDKIQFDFICDEDSTDIPYEEIEKLGGKVILCPPYQKLLKYLKFLKQLFREKKYHIVHSNINTLSIFPLYAAKRAGVPVRIAHSHSTSNPREWKKNMIKNALRPLSKKYATDYFACSELAGRYLFGNKTFDKGKVKIVSNAINVEKFKFDPEARMKLRREIGIKEHDFVIGHIGRFVEQKNHRFLIDVFAEIKKENKNTKLVLVGQGPLREEMEQKVKDLGLEKDVFFLGQRRDTNKLYSVFDIFYLPSLYEGLPVVGVEAQANGVPCVFSINVTKETIYNNAKMLDYAKICNAVLDKKLTRKNTNNDTFDIRKTVKDIQDYYLVKNKPTILHVVGSNVFSGLEKVAFGIIKNLSDDYDFVYVTKDGPIRQKLEEEKIDFEIIKSVTPFGIRKVVKKYKPALIHAHDYRASVTAALALTKTPVICHLHNNSPWIKKSCFYSFAFLFAAMQSKIILTVSESIGKEYIFSKLIHRKIKNISNPVDYKKIREKISRMGKIEKEYDICCVARVTMPKNPYRFIGIIKRIKENNPKIRAVWVGNGEMLEECRRIALEEGLEKNIEYVGYTNNPFYFYAKSKVFMLTSSWEGYGLAVFEALASGLPCIVSDVGGLKNLVNNKCGKLCETDYDFIEAYKSIDNNLRKYSGGAIKRAKELDNSKVYYEQIGAIYEE